MDNDGSRERDIDLQPIFGWGRDEKWLDTAVHHLGEVLVEGDPTDPPARVAGGTIVEHDRHFRIRGPHRPRRQVPRVPLIRARLEAGRLLAPRAGHRLSERTPDP